MPVPAGHPEKPEGVDGRSMLDRMNTGAHEELALWGLSHIHLAAGSSALDVGCGGGANLVRLRALADDVHVVGIDYSPLAVEVSRETNQDAIEAGTCEVLAGSVDALPCDTQVFDLVTAFETVYFWPDMTSALAEIHRVLKPGGHFLICNEANGQTEAANEIAEEIDIMSIYSADDFRTMLGAARFEVVEIDDEGRTGRITVVAQAV